MPLQRAVVVVQVAQLGVHRAFGGDVAHLPDGVAARGAERPDEKVAEEAGPVDAHKRVLECRVDTFAMPTERLGQPPRRPCA